ncbi:MAG: hypothetical protein VZR33_08845 [Methanosphaera sp.]|nr:hypothetical protein [Methanosphaera sp.]
MSNLLKVKVGGSDYLCRWKQEKVWELDIKNLTIQSQTLSNGLILEVNNPQNITKIDNDTKIRATGYFSFNITNLNILGKIKKVEMVIDSFSDGGRYAYAGAILTYIRSSYDYNKYGPWNATKSSGGKTWTILEGYPFSVETYPPYKWTGYQGIDVTFPMTYKVLLSDKIETYFDDVKISEKENDLDTYPTDEIWYNVEINSGGYSTADIIISSVKVYYE